MKARRTAKYKVVPTNIRNGHTAPYFILESEKKVKRDELNQLATEEFKQRSSLARYENWQLSIDKI